MSRQDICKLVDSFSGHMILRLTTEEARSMVREGTAKRIDRHKYSLIKPVAPSNSGDSPPMLDRFDMEVVASGRAPTECEFERLLGWGFRVRKPVLPQAPRQEMAY